MSDLAKLIDETCPVCDKHVMGPNNDRCYCNGSELRARIRELLAQIPPPMTEEDHREHEALMERNERRRIINRAISVQRWWRLRYVAHHEYPNGRIGAGFIIDDVRPEGDDHMQFDTPMIASSAVRVGQRKIEDGDLAVGRYVSNISSGWWEVWAFDENYDAACVTSRCVITTPEQALWAMYEKERLT